MRAFWTMSLVLAACVAGIPAAGHAFCPVPTTITIDGIDYVDTDCDGIRDIDFDQNPVDNCREAPNGNCETDPIDCDISGDGAPTAIEIAGGDQHDWNHNDIGDACDDADKDGVADYRDNCRAQANPEQGVDDCQDTDRDGIQDDADNCRVIWNPSQDNSDSDSFGDACDICAFETNEDQDPSVCPESEQSGPGPGGTPSTTVPAVGGNTPNLPDHVEGSGGCALTPQAGVSAWSMLLVLASVGVAAVWRRRGR